ncbi:MCE family protein [Mycobacterium sp. URHB0044]|jgi:phospholipid/cholesterol/gamma-HCH transport system substrate-binding protein|uniref:MCE family protein n=1 Tax=Mycobacterium sp. URHB0044 TaxID=1380386 RepID=UPI00048E5F0C|nr:MCE family protein [Mycobacterium sp. URHB0044]
MKSFSERNPFVLGAVGSVVTIGLLVAATNYDKLPFFGSKHYSAYFAEAGGLVPGAAVQISGMETGNVESVELDKGHVLVTFDMSTKLRLGDRSEAAIKTKSLLGSKVLEVTPRGDGQQDGPIPLDRTTSAYQLPEAVGDLTSAISGLDVGQLSDSLAVLADTFKDTPPDLKVAVQGVARISDTLNKRDAELRNLLANANKATTVLRDRGDQVVSLVANANALLIQLQSQSAALDDISGNIAAVSRQIKGFTAEQRGTFKGALDKLNGALAIIDNRKVQVQQSITLLNKYAMSLGESVSSGPFFKAYVANLLPGQFLQPFIDAAFSDLGLDPNVLLPSQSSDPQVGQPGTPPLPLPYPRTGQGGEPRLTLPDAITGKPGDQPCGPAGVPLPGPGCYPYREPVPAPPAGGPPPGPPAVGPPSLNSIANPAPSPLPAPAPNMAPTLGDGQ